MKYKLSFEQISIIIAMILFAFLMIFSCLGCEQDPRIKEERKAQELRDKELILCVVIKVTINNKGQVRETYYRCLEDEGIYKIRAFIGNEGDTVKVMKQRMYCRQN